MHFVHYLLTANIPLEIIYVFLHRLSASDLILQTHIDDFREKNRAFRRFPDCAAAKSTKAFTP
jgi:hypothetical protein